VSYEKSNGICPKHCSCTILYKEVLIEVALEDLCNHFCQEREYPTYDKQYMVVVCDAFWGARMEQMCCQLDKNVAMTCCIEPAAHNFVRTYVCNYDEIPSSVRRRISSLMYPPREALSGVLIASLVIRMMTSRPDFC
jgi:hypothetical protein